MKKFLILLTCIFLITGCGSSKDSDKTNETKDEKIGYVITLGSQDIMVNDDFSTIKDKLGDDYENQEIESCAFEGMDTIYTYEDYEIYNYHDGDKEKIYTITLLTDNVETNEGIKIGDSVDEVVSKYGEDYNDAIGAYSYTKGDTILTFIFEDDKVVSIEYKLKVE